MGVAPVQMAWTFTCKHVLEDLRPVMLCNAKGRLDRGNALPILYAFGNELEHDSVSLGLEACFEATGKSVFRSDKHGYSLMSSPTKTH